MKAKKLKPIRLTKKEKWTLWRAACVIEMFEDGDKDHDKTFRNLRTRIYKIIKRFSRP